MTQIHSGGCLCGEVRFTVTGRPLQVLVCHCTMCQRATGSAFSVEPVFLKERIEVRGGPLAIYNHRSADHGRMLHFSFCGTCGNRIGLTLERFPTVQSSMEEPLTNPHGSLQALTSSLPAQCLGSSCRVTFSASGSTCSTLTERQFHLSRAVLSVLAGYMRPRSGTAPNPLQGLPK